MRRMIGMMMDRLSGIKHKTYVGVDIHNNKFFTFLSEEGQWRRMVEYNDGGRNRDPGNIEGVWNMWLTYRRDSPPSDDELQKTRDHRKLIQARAKQVDLADKKLRLQEQAEKRRSFVGDEEQNNDYNPTQFLQSYTAHLNQKQIQQQDSSPSSSSFEEKPRKP
eukprot:TRINITY_DN6058_c0_g1_i1.p1 TRINITY_DN6058_c0_g1~~TRINITY_DN6058_c0_g1_i1.p1  ORF type:complete len:163 (-),score=66.22 TRINITY_DN6058_c0_g1_i1:21-509(-)